MVEALHGHDAVPFPVIVDQAGTYLVLSTLGMVAVAFYTSTGTSTWVMARKVLTFPPFIAVCFAFLLMDVDYPAWLRQMLQRLSDTVAPLAVLSVGCQMHFSGIRNHLKPLSIGLLYKLVICPSLVLITHLLFIPPQMAPQSHVALLEAAMGPQIGAGIIATQNHLDPELVVLLVGIGTILALLTVPIWSLIFHTLGSSG